MHSCHTISLFKGVKKHRHLRTYPAYTSSLYWNVAVLLRGFRTGQFVNLLLHLKVMYFKPYNKIKYFGKNFE